MSVVEDFRQVLQDFLAPQLRALEARLDAIEKVTEARLKEVENVMEARFKEVGSRFKEIDSRFKEIDSRFKEVDSRFNEVTIRLQAVQESIDRNDASQKQMISGLIQQFQFEKRVAEIEQELKRTRPTVA